MTSKQVPVSELVRKMSAPQRRFSAELYRWALKDARREYSQGFPLLRRIKSTAVTDYLKFVGMLSPGEKRMFAIGEVKRAHRAGCFLAEDVMSEGESALVERYLTRNIRHDSLLGRVAIVSRAQQRRWKEIASGSKKYQIDRRRLRAALKQRLAPILGDTTETFGSSIEWWYSTPVGRWTVRTWVDTGGRYQLKYGHTVSIRPHVTFTEHISIVGWLGIPTTGWDLLTNADIPAAAALVAELCSHFIKAIPEIQKTLQS